MTSVQRRKFFGTYWPDICQARGWDADDREFCLTVVSGWLGRRIESRGEINHLKDFDEVKAQWLAAIDPANMRAQVNQSEQPRRRLIWRITHMAPPNYTAAIARDKFGTEVLDELSDSQLTMLRNTLAARSNALRRRASQPAQREAEVAAENIPF